MDGQPNPESERHARAAQAIAALRSYALSSPPQRRLIDAAVAQAHTALSTEVTGWVDRLSASLSFRDTPAAPRAWVDAAPECRRSNSILADALRTTSPTVVPDIAIDPRPAGLLTGYRSALIAPAVNGGRIIGGIVTASTQTNAFDETDISTAATMTALLSSVHGVAADATPNNGGQLRFEYPQAMFGLWAWDPVTHQIWMSPETETMHGLAPGEFGGTVDDLIALLGGIAVNDLRTRAGNFFDPSSLGSTQYQITSDGGTTRTIAIRGRRENPEDPQSQWIGIALDVSDQQRREAELVAANSQVAYARHLAQVASATATNTQDRLFNIIREAPVGFALLDTRGHIITTNARFAEMADARQADSVDQALRDWSPRLWDRLGPAIQTALEHFIAVEHLEIASDPGPTSATTRVWTTTVFPTISAESVTELGIVALEITEQKRAERVERLFREFSELFTSPQHDAAAALRFATALPVPGFADYCAIAARLPDTNLPVGFFAHAVPGSPLIPAHELPPPTVNALLDAVEANGTGLSRYRARPVTNGPLLHALRPMDLGDAMVVPLSADATVVGALVIGVNRDTRHHIHARDIGVIEELGFRCSTRLATEKHRAQAERTGARLRLLAELGRLTSRGIATDEGMRAITEALCPLYADLVIVVMRQDSHFVPVLGHATNPKSARWLQTLHRSAPTTALTPMAHSLAAGKPLYFTREDILEHPGDFHSSVRELFTQTNLASGISIPLYGSEGTLGSVFCGIERNGRTLTDEDIALAPEIGLLLSPIFETILRLKRARENTATLQRSLLPAQLPEHFGIQMAAHYRPAETELSVGGDWYDAIELADGSLLLAIGDVVGHGAAAAGLTGQLRTALRIASTQTSDVAALLGMMHRFVIGLGALEVATTLLVRIDRNRNTFEWASAGHLPPLLQHRDQSVEYCIGEAGPPLGALLHPRYEHHASTIAPGDALLLYTDGLVERRDESIDVGMTRLATATASVTRVAHDPAAVLATIITETLSGKAPNDDIAALMAFVDHTLRATAFSIPPDPEALRTVRQRLEAFLRTYRASDAEIADVLLIASELCSNAIEHGSPTASDDVSVSCALSGIGIELNVENLGNWNVNTPLVGGRGLQIVRSLAASLEVTGTHGGVRMTAALSRRPQRAAAPIPTQR
ncbi:MAG: SpoIIE family protein phosphatase [Acidimicrobiia bacterium]